MARVDLRRERMPLEDLLKSPLLSPNARSRLRSNRHRQSESVNAGTLTIGRELEQNGGMHGYQTNNAGELARERARRPQVCKQNLPPNSAATSH